MTEERYVRKEIDDGYAVFVMIWDNTTEKEIGFNSQVVDLLNKQEERIQELEGITKRLDRLNNKLIQENTEQCKTCELVKVQHEQIQDLKQQLSKIPDSVKKNWI